MIAPPTNQVTGWVSQRPPAEVLAAIAGAAGRRTEPLTTVRRLANYRKQNGTRRLTPKQERRLNQKGWKETP